MQAFQWGYINGFFGELPQDITPNCTISPLLDFFGGLVVTCLISTFQAFSISRWHPFDNISYTISALYFFGLLLKIALSALLPSYFFSWESDVLSLKILKSKNLWCSALIAVWAWHTNLWDSLRIWLEILMPIVRANIN